MAAEVDAPAFKYRAFLSYSHHDEKTARRLHVALENYRVPSALVGTPGAGGPIPATLFPIFRDRDELSPSFSLSDRLQEALRASAHLVVLCSPASARSRWVNEEILSFKRMGRAERIHALVVDGDPLAHPGEAACCFPPNLLAMLDAHGEVRPDTQAEPIAADLRPEGDGIADARLKLIAAILGLSFNALRQRERIAARRRRRIQHALGAALTLLVIGVGIATDLALRFRSVADDRQMLGVRMVDHVSTLDLSGWQPTSDAEIAALVKKSSAVTTDSYTVVKTQVFANTYVHIIGTSSAIPPEVSCDRCDISDRRPDGASRTAHEYRLTFDISKVGLEQAIPVQYVTKYWNAFQTPDQWWGGVRISDPTESVRFDVVFPATKHPLATTLVYYYTDIKDHPFPTTPDVVLQADPADAARVTRLSWRVPFPLTDRSYRIRWDWSR